VFGPQEQCPVIARLSAEAACADPAITCHLVDAGEPDATLEQSFALAARLRQMQAAPPPVQPVLDVACAIAPLFATDKLVFLPPIIVGAGVTVSALRNREADQQAADSRVDERMARGAARKGRRLAATTAVIVASS
jgi:hypothetical protein